MKTIYLAGGDFWQCEECFRNLKGVYSTQVGFANGKNKKVSKRREVMNSGHAETVKIVYDEDQTSLSLILKTFFEYLDLEPDNSMQHVCHRYGIYFKDSEDLDVINSAKSVFESKRRSNCNIEVRPLYNYSPADKAYQRIFVKYCNPRDFE